MMNAIKDFNYCMSKDPNWPKKMKPEGLWNS